MKNFLKIEVNKKKMEEHEQSNNKDSKEKNSDTSKKRTEEKNSNDEPMQIKEIFDELGKGSKADNAIGELFYNSIKTFFEIGVQLLENMNLESLISDGKIEEKKD